MASLQELTEERLRKLVAEEKIGSDACSKSLRCYDTWAHPMFIERWSVLKGGIDLRSTTEGFTFQYDEDVPGLTGSNVMNYVFKSFYLQEPCEVVDMIYPKLSMKTSVMASYLEGIDMRSEVTQWVEGFKMEDDSVVELRTLAEVELGTDIVRDILDNTRNSTMTQGIEALLLQNYFKFPCNEFVCIQGRSIDRDLKMKVKYYPARDDLRAYCSDNSRLRSLVASCLNRMISPKSMKQRLELDSARVLRPDKKDILDIHLPQAQSPEIKSYLMLADISNFTGSLGNSWFMIFIMGLELASGRLEDRYQLFGVGPSFLAASWKELLLLYTYLTVGMPCWVEDWSEFAYLSGGFLGVGGNITIGLLCLAVIVQDLLYRLGREFYVRSQAGGDDIAFVVQCSESQIEEVSEQIRKELRRYIGNLKEFSVVGLDDLNDGVVPDAKFCRKRIFVRRDEYGLHLEGEPSVPLGEVLTTSTNLRHLHQQVEAWCEMDQSLLSFEAKLPGSTLITNCLRRLFFERYPNVEARRTKTVKYLSGKLHILQMGRSQITDLAHALVCNIRSVQHRDISALVEYDDKLRHALVTEVVVIEKVRVGLWVEDVIVSKEESKLLTVKRATESVDLECDEDLLRRLRSYLAFN